MPFRIAMYSETQSLSESGVGLRVRATWESCLPQLVNLYYAAVQTAAAVSPARRAKGMENSAANIDTYIIYKYKYVKTFPRHTINMYIL